MGLAADLLAFFEEHRRCGQLDGGVQDGWMACECGALISRIVEASLPPERA